MPGLEENKSVLTAAQYALCSKLSSEYNQAHLFADWPAAGTKDEDKKRLANQLVKLDGEYPGGLSQYVTNAIKLLEDSKIGKNPFDGFTPEVPTGERLIAGNSEFDKFEAKGMEEMAGACFVLVAGGLGERLGYQGIKVALPTETTTGKVYLQLYAESILAFQERARIATGNKDLLLPLAIMTSGDTHDKTVALLKANNYFGLEAQLTLMKQELVPAILDNSGRFSVNEKDPFQIDTKPHGHGDVHTLLHSTKVIHKWASEGRKWVCFFQDTNGLVMHAFPAAIGVSSTHDFEVNSLTVPRRPGEAVGGICKLVNSAEKKELTINVEYNQLDPLLRATVSPDGDVADDSGFSPYPGNINVLVFKLEPFAAVLDRTNGSVPEFVNPKYADEAKEKFKKPTRLECMMQDYPRLLEAGSKVGFTQMERYMSFSAVKNNPTDAVSKMKDSGFAESATTGESDMYKVNREFLKFAGVEIIGDDSVTEYLGMPMQNGPRVVLAPSFGTTLAEVKTRFPTPEKVSLSPTSSLILEGDIVIHKLTLDGDLRITAAPGAKVIVKSLNVKNKGSELVPVEGDDVPQQYAMRGFVRKEYECLNLDKSTPGEQVIDRE